jgi:hypothetical protein
LSTPGHALATGLGDGEGDGEGEGSGEGDGDGELLGKTPDEEDELTTSDELTTEDELEIIEELTELDFEELMGRALQSPKAD